MSYIEAMLVGLGVAAVIWGAAFLIGKFLEASIDGRPEYKLATESFPKRAMLESRFELRKAERQAEIARLNVEVNTLRRRRFALEKDIQDVKREADAPIRTLGREGGSASKFRAWLVNRQVQGALSEGKPHPTLDSEWASPQIVEIWADNVNEARKEIQRVYPMPLGFSVLNIKLDAVDARPTESADQEAPP